MNGEESVMYYLKPLHERKHYWADNNVISSSSHSGVMTETGGFAGYSSPKLGSCSEINPTFVVDEGLDLGDVVRLRVEVSYYGAGARWVPGELFDGIGDKDVGVLGGGG